MTPGEHARLAMDAIVNMAHDNQVAMVVIAVGTDGYTHIVTNVASESDVAQILEYARETQREPETVGIRRNPARA
jgi:hypothetical protein